MEIWKVIPEHPNYEVSNLGRIRRVDTGYVLKQSTSGKYLAVGLGRTPQVITRKVHRLVLEAFVGGEGETTWTNLSAHKRGEHR